MMPISPRLRSGNIRIVQDCMCVGGCSEDFYLTSNGSFLHILVAGLLQYLVLCEEEVTEEHVDEISDLFRTQDNQESSSSEDAGDDAGHDASPPKGGKGGSKKAQIVLTTMNCL